MAETPVRRYPVLFPAVNRLPNKGKSIFQLAPDGDRHQGNKTIRPGRIFLKSVQEIIPENKGRRDNHYKKKNGIEMISTL
jgi:hypothetical protein